MGSDGFSAPQIPPPAVLLAAAGGSGLLQWALAPALGSGGLGAVRAAARGAGDAYRSRAGWSVALVPRGLAGSRESG